MPDVHATLKDLFALRQKGQRKADADDTLVSLGETVSVQVKDAKVEPSVLRDALLDSMDGLLELELSSLIGTAWSKAKLLQQYRDKTKFGPNEAITVAMAEHTIRSNHRPSIELLINDKRVDSLPVEISLQIAVEGLVLKIQDGRIKEVRPGTCTASGRITCKDWVVSEQKAKPIVLPGVLSLGDGIEIPPWGGDKDPARQT